MMLPDPVGLIGLSKSDAIKMLEETDIDYRIVKEDDEIFMVTMDVVMDRVNLTIEDNIITNAYTG